MTDADKRLTVTVALTHAEHAQLIRLARAVGWSITKTKRYLLTDGVRAEANLRGVIDKVLK